VCVSERKLSRAAAAADDVVVAAADAADSTIYIPSTRLHFNAFMCECVCVLLLQMPF